MDIARGVRLETRVLSAERDVSLSGMRDLVRKFRWS